MLFSCSCFFLLINASFRGNPTTAFPLDSRPSAAALHPNQYALSPTNRSVPPIFGPGSIAEFEKTLKLYGRFHGDSFFVDPEKVEGLKQFLSEPGNNMPQLLKAALLGQCEIRKNGAVVSPNEPTGENLPPLTGKYFTRLSTGDREILARLKLIEAEGTNFKPTKNAEETLMQLVESIASGGIKKFCWIGGSAISNLATALVIIWLENSHFQMGSSESLAALIIGATTAAICASSDWFTDSATWDDEINITELLRVFHILRTTLPEQTPDQIPKICRWGVYLTFIRDNPKFLLHRMQESSKLDQRAQIPDNLFGELFNQFTEQMSACYKQVRWLGYIKKVATIIANTLCIATLVYNFARASNSEMNSHAQIQTPDGSYFDCLCDWLLNDTMNCTQCSTQNSRSAISTGLSVSGIVTAFINLIATVWQLKAIRDISWSQANISYLELWNRFGKQYPDAQESKRTGDFLKQSARLAAGNDTDLFGL